MEYKLNLIIFDKMSSICVERLNYLLNKYFAKQNFQFTDSEIIMNNDDLIHCLPNRVDKKIQFNSSIFEYKQLATYENVILVVDRNEYDEDFHGESFNLINMTALYYKIFFEKTICLISNWPDIEGCLYNIKKIDCYPFPYFTWYLNLNEDCEMEEMDLRAFDQKETKIPTAFEISEEAEKIFEKEKNDYYYSYSIKNDQNFVENCRYIFEYAERGMKEDAFKKLANSKNENYMILYKKFITNSDLLFYNSAFLSQESLVKNIQISLPKPGDKVIYIFNSASANKFMFRNLKYDDVCLAHNNQIHFILPYYKMEQYTKQAIRFLIMYLYKVDQNSVLVDYITIYLCIKLTNLSGISGLEKKMVETRIKNIANLFLDRPFGKTTLKQFILNSKAIPNLEFLKTWFIELNGMHQDEILEVFQEYLLYGNKKIECKEMKVEVVKFFQSLDEKFPTHDSKIEELFLKNKDEKTSILLNNQNWPININYSLDQNKYLQINSSRSMFICCDSQEKFEEKLSEFNWIKYIPMGFVLKGGAIIDLLCDRNPKDFDFFNVSLDNQQYIKEIITFCKKTKPKNIQVNILSKLSVIRVTLEKETIEFVNSKISKQNLFTCESMPDQIAYITHTKEMYANEYTLFSLNYGYAELSVDRHPWIDRVSKYMDKGFSFYFNNNKMNDPTNRLVSRINNTPKSLKSLLERMIWLVENGKTDGPKKKTKRRKSYDEKPALEEPEEEQKKNDYVINPDNNLYKNETCRLFSSLEEYILYVKEAKLNEYNGAVILPKVEHESSGTPEFLNLIY